MSLRTPAAFGAGLVVAVVVVGSIGAGLALVVGAGTTLLSSDVAPSSRALSDTPPAYLRTFEAAATTCPGLPWTVLAGIGRVETDFGADDQMSSAGAVVIYRWNGGQWHLRHEAVGGRGLPVSEGSLSRRQVGGHTGFTGPPLMTTSYRAWRAVSPSDGASTWVIVDDDFELHDGGCAFLRGLRAADRSVNTERVYAGRVALFLSWCAEQGLDWTRPRLDHMVGFKRWLVADPGPTAGDQLKKTDLVERVDELTGHNRKLSAELAQAQADARELRARVADLEDDLTSARTSLRGMVRAENISAGPPATESGAAH